MPINYSSHVTGNEGKSVETHASRPTDGQTHGRGIVLL